MSLPEFILVTGGAGFIGSNFVLRTLVRSSNRIINLDCLTYAGNLDNLCNANSDAHYVFVHGDIADGELVWRLLDAYRPVAILNFAAETHVDRSIARPDEFIHSNVLGTFSLLEQARRFLVTLPAEETRTFRFLQISTDEVYGSLGPGDPAFTELSRFAPNSPYAASKAASDHLVRAYHHTYGVPTLISNCCNNYGPRQFPEKLIPLVISNALKGKAIPIYGDGKNVRDWIHVDDHCSAIQAILVGGRPGETYNVGANNERSNVEIILEVCAILDELLPDSPCRPHSSLMEYVDDRPGHDRRYATNASKLRHQLHWAPRLAFEAGLRNTVLWYLENREWLEGIRIVPRPSSQSP